MRATGDGRGSVVAHAEAYVRTSPLPQNDATIADAKKTRSLPSAPVEPDPVEPS